MKNKLLVSVFATAIAVFAFTSCESKSDVTEVCTDLVQVSLHKSARSLLEVKGETLTITEFEFASSNVNDNRLMYRTLSFGNGVFVPKKVETMTYAYGDWNEQHTAYSLYVKPVTDAPFTMWYGSNAFLLPDGRSIGGEGSDNTARVEKWEKVITTFSNTDWETIYKAEITYDSIFDIKYDTILLPPTFIKFRIDTIKTFVRLDPVSADTTCTYVYQFDRNATTYANTGTCTRTSVRSKYDRETKTADTISVNVDTYGFNWYFSSVSSDSKFSVTLNSTTSGMEGEVFDISKYKLDSLGSASEFLRNGLMYTRPQP